MIVKSEQNRALLLLLVGDSDIPRAKCDATDRDADGKLTRCNRDADGAIGVHAFCDRHMAIVNRGARRR